MNIADVFSKALDEAFEQGMTIDKAVAFAELRLEDHREVQAKRRWRIILGIAATVLILVFMLWQFGPDLRLLVTGDATPTPTPTSPGQETPALSNNYQIIVRSNNQAANEIEFVTEQEHALVVSSDNNQLPDDAVVTFQWVDSCANVGFSNNQVAVENGEATTTFKPTFTGECRLQVNLVLPGSSDVPKTETFPIKIVSATSPQLTIRAEIRNEMGEGVDFVEANRRFLLKLYVINEGDASASNAVVTITLPDDISAPENPNNPMRIDQIDIPARQPVIRDVFLIAPYIQDTVEKNVTIADYRVEYEGQEIRGEAVEFIVRNPSPGNIIFELQTPAISRTTPITVTALGFDGQPTAYSVPFTFTVDPPDAGRIETVSTSEGRTVVNFSPATIAVSQATIIAQSGILTRSLPIVITPSVINTGTGNAENNLYHRLTDDTRSQIVILPDVPVEPGSDEGNPDLVNGRIVYRLAVGTPVRVLGESRVVDDNGESKIFYRVAVRFWISSRAVNTAEYFSGPELPSGYLRIAQGAVGTTDDSWRIFTGGIAPTEIAQTSATTGLMEHATDVDNPDLVIVQVIDNAAFSDWVYIEVEGWLAENVIGFFEG